MRPLPKCVQISETLIREIASGKLPDGARLPTERDMAADHGVAVGTMRKALAILADKDLLKRVQGSGNYIQARSDIESVYTFFRLERIGGGGLPTARLLQVDRVVRPEPARSFSSDQAHRIRRLRYLDGMPVALEEIWLDAHYVEHIDQAALSESLYYYYKNDLDLVISAAEDRVSLGHVPPWGPTEFQLQAGAPCGFIERIGTSQSGTTAEYSQTWFDPAVANYIMRLK